MEKNAMANDMAKRGCILALSAGPNALRPQARRRAKGSDFPTRAPACGTFTARAAGWN